jgi:hypothetical protein
MKRFLIITCITCFMLDSCTISIPTEGQQDPTSVSTQWIKHSTEAVPNYFGEKPPKRFLKDGYYEQAGSVASSWEVAHYTYLGYNNVQIGIAQLPYSISSSGRFVAILEDYYSGAKTSKLKIYDKSRNRYLIREIPPLAIRGYNWEKDEQAVTALHYHNSKALTRRRSQHPPRRKLNPS